MGEIRLLPARRSLRLQGYDYASAGAYFITVCAYERRCLFGNVIDKAMTPNETGRIAERCWQAIPDHFPGVEIDEFVLMPNHLHGIVVLANTVRGMGDPSRQIDQSAPVAPTGPTRRSIAAIVGSFKSAATREINRLRGAEGAPVWQRGYYEHIIRNEQALGQILQYIADNPRLWAEDAENPLASSAR